LLWLENSDKVGVDTCKILFTHFSAGIMGTCESLKQNSRSQS